MCQEFIYFKFPFFFNSNSNNVTVFSDYVVFVSFYIRTVQSVFMFFMATLRQ